MRPVTLTGLVAPVVVIPVLEVTLYEVITPPPFDVGAVKVIVAWALPATAVTPVGAPGVAVVTLLEGADAGPVPMAFVAVTVKV